MVVFIWNELERQATRQQRELNAKKAKDDDFAQSLERYDHVGARGNSDDSWSPWAPGGKVKLKPVKKRIFFVLTFYRAIAD